MADIINIRGNRKDFSLRRGQTLGPFTFDCSELGTVSSSRLVVRSGTLARPGTIAFSVTPTIASNQVTWNFTPTQTRLLTALSDYCYEFEVTADGLEVGISEGMIEVGEEIATA